MELGDTFLWLGRDDHLWMVISKPDATGRAVVVGLYSYQPRYDQACLLEVGDHPSVKHTSCIMYANARLVAMAKLDSLQQAGELKLKVPLAPALLARIQAAAIDGDINTECYATLRDQGLVP